MGSRGAPPSNLPPIYRGGERGQPHPYAYIRATALLFLSLIAIFFSVVLSEALPRFLHHHRHHAIVLPDDSSYYFTIARWIEKVKASSSRTCVECRGAVRSALGSGVRGTDRDWISKMFDYINRISSRFRLAISKGSSMT